MILNVVIEEQNYPVDVPAEIVAEGEEFFRKLDRDMDRGWQMSRDWVDNPDQEQRCQIIGDRYVGFDDRDVARVLLKQRHGGVNE